MNFQDLFDLPLLVVDITSTFLSNKLAIDFIWMVMSDNIHILLKSKAEPMKAPKCYVGS